MPKYCKQQNDTFYRVCVTRTLKTLLFVRIFIHTYSYRLRFVATSSKHNDNQGNKKFVTPILQIFTFEFCRLFLFCWKGISILSEMDATRSRKRMGEQAISYLAKYTGFSRNLSSHECFDPLWIFIKLMIWTNQNACKIWLLWKNYLCCTRRIEIVLVR